MGLMPFFIAMPFQSIAQQRFAFGTKQPWAKRWAKETDFSKIPKRVRKKMQQQKDAGTMPGAMLSGPGGLLATPGMGGRKWGNRRKDKACTCGVNVATKEQLAPGVTRIRGNLCNVHGRYGPCDASQSGKRKPKVGKGRVPKGRKPAKPKVTPEQRAQEHAAQQTANRTKVLGQLGIAPDGQQALEALRSGAQPDAAALERGGFVKAGLVEQAADGSYRLTPSGRAALAAASSGDAGRAGDIISSARDRTSARTARQEETAQRKRDAEAKRAAAAAERAKRAEEAKRGGGKGSSSRSSGNGIDARQQREAERQADRKRRQEEHAQDRAQRQREHEQDRAQRQQEHEQDRAQRQQEHEQDRAQRLEERRQAIAERRRSKPASVATHRTPIVMPNRTTRRTKAMNEPMAVWNGTSWIAAMKAGNPGDYLIVEDRDHPTTWHLQVKKNGTPDHRLMGAAWAALHGGYRGNKYSGPNKGEAISKLRALYKREKMPVPGEKSYEAQSSFAVFKDDTDAWRWVARTTTAYRDRDGEIITTKALELDAQRMTQTKQFGPLRYWHIGNPDPFDPLAPWGNGLDIGTCDYSIVIGRTSIESGTFKSHAIGKAFAEHAADYELSPGFFHPPDQPNVAGEYDNIRRFERSVVPIKYGRASNLFTGLTVKEHRMDQQTYKARVEAFMKDMNAKGVPPEIAATALAGMEQADKSATAQGIAYKSDDAPQVYTSPDGTQGIISDGRFVALKAAAPPMDAEDDPALGGDAGVDEAAEGEPPIDDGADQQYIGDMSPDDFKAMLAELLAPVLKMQDMVKAMGDMHGELKTMYGGATTKSDEQDAAHLKEIATLKAEQEKLAARLAELTGDQPAVTMPADIEAAVKSEGPKAPPTHPAVPQFDPSRPFQGWAAQTWPQLYDNTNLPNRS